MIDKDTVYAKIGMTSVSIQRVERVSKTLIIYLKIADEDIKTLSSTEFLDKIPNLLALSYIKDESQMDSEIKNWKEDYELYLQNRLTNS
jgi:hypothetical protein